MAKLRALLSISLLVFPIITSESLRAEGPDLDAYKFRVQSSSWFSHPSGSFSGRANGGSFDVDKDLGFGDYSTFSGQVNSRRKNYFVLGSVAARSETASLPNPSDPFASSEAVIERLSADSQDGTNPKKKSDWDTDPHGWHFIVYPAYVWVPFFSSSVTLPEIPSPPGVSTQPVVPSGTTSGSFNGAAFAGAQIDKDKWEGMFTFLYAGLSATRTTPRATLNMDFVYGQAMVGREVYKGFYLEGGFRRMALDLTATLDTYPSVSRTPGFWDPLLGLTYRRQLNKKWRVTGHMDGGGFGVGSDYDVGAAASADWRFAKHFGMTMGGAYLHFEDSNTVLRRTLTIKPSLYGPTFGFGIYF